MKIFCSNKHRVRTSKTLLSKSDFHILQIQILKGRGILHTLLYEGGHFIYGRCPLHFLFIGMISTICIQELLQLQKIQVCIESRYVEHKRDSLSGLLFIQVETRHNNRCFEISNIKVLWGEHHSVPILQQLGKRNNIQRSRLNFCLLA